MFDLVNQDRATAGLPPLEIDMRLIRAARIKSQVMHDDGYFAHTAPDGISVGFNEGSRRDHRKREFASFGWQAYFPLIIVELPVNVQ